MKTFRSRLELLAFLGWQDGTLWDALKELARRRVDAVIETRLYKFRVRDGQLEAI